MLIQTLPVGPLQVNCHLVGCRQTGEALVIDPGDEGSRILAVLDDAGLKVRLIVNTHAHFDHIGANRDLMAATGAELLLHAADLPLLKSAAAHAANYGLATTPSPPPTRLIAEGDTVQLGELSFSVLHVPGHSPGSICLLGGGHLFAGDVLFAGSVGRTDLPGGNHQQLIDGIRSKLLVLPPETVVHTGHGPDTTIGDERYDNPFCGLGYRGDA